MSLPSSSVVRVSILLKFLLKAPKKLIRSYSALFLLTLPTLALADLGYVLNYEYDVNSGTLPAQLNSTFHVTQGSGSVANGAYQYSVPIYIPPTTNNIGPKLSYTYSSANPKDSNFGVGWTLSGIGAITRCQTSFATEGAQAQKPNPRYTIGDRLCLNGMKLILREGTKNSSDAEYWQASAVYQTELDTFTKVVANSDHTQFTVYLKNGLIQQYGDNEGQNSTYYRPGYSSGSIKRWGLAKTQDRYGNSYKVYYEYDTAKAEQVIKRIKADPNVEIVFDYGSQFGGGIRFGYDMGNKYVISKLLNGITVKKVDPFTNQHIANIRYYKFNYNNDGNTYYNLSSTNRLLLNTLVECGFTGNAGVETEVCGLPLKFGWTTTNFGFENTLQTSSTSNGVDQRIDLDGNGYVDYLHSSGVILYSATGSQRVFDGLLLRSRDPANTVNSYPIRFKNGFGVIRVTSTRTRNAQGQLSGSPTSIVELIKKLNDQNGHVVSTISPSLTFPTIPHILVADFNADGLDDVCTSNLIYFQSPATGDLGNPKSPGCGGSPGSTDLAAYDINSDGLNDRTSVWLSVDSNLNPPKVNSATLQAFINLGNSFIGSQDFNPNFFWRPAVSLTEYYQYGTGFGYMTNPLSGTHRTMIDLNGDGLLDVLYINSAKKVTFRLNTGFGLTSETVTSSIVEYGQGFVLDYNKDGLQDYIHTWGTGAGNGQANVRVYTAGSSNGQTTLSGAAANTVGLGILTAGNASSCSYSASKICEILALRWVDESKNLIIGDHNNDGLLDVATSQGHYRAIAGQYDYLNTITDGLGKEIKVTYSELVSGVYTPTAAAYPFAPVNRDKYAVTAVRTSNGVSSTSTNTQNFYYTGGKIDVTGRGFAGFESIRMVDSATGNSITTQYHQAFPLTGRVKSQVVKDNAGNTLNERYSYYKTHPENAHFSFENHRYELAYEKTDSASLVNTASTEQRFEYDNFGNPTNHRTIRGTDFYTNGDGYYAVLQPEHELEIVNQYTNNEYNHLLGFLNNTRSNYRFSDGSENRTYCTTFSPQANTLDIYYVFENCDWHTQTGTNYKATIYNRNNKGIITQIKHLATDTITGQATGRTETFEDFEYDIYPRRILNGLQHATTLIYNPRHSAAQRITDPNGFATEMGYDPWGKEISAKDITTGNTLGMGMAVCSGSPCPSGAAFYKREQTTNALVPNKASDPVTTTFYDKIGREVRRDSFKFITTKITTEYTSDGQIYRVSEPYTGNSPQHWTRYTYDKKGRITATSFPDGKSKTTNFRGESNRLKISETITYTGVSGSPEEQIKTTYHNAVGQVSQVVDAMGNRVDYDYDAQGNLKSTMVNGNVNSTVSIIHDSMGNKTQIIDPDSGKINFTYNGFSEMRLQTWQKDTPNAKSMEFQYDSLGRKTRRIDRHPGRSDQHYTWEWDTRFLGVLSASYIVGSNIGQFYAHNLKGQIESIGRERSGGWRFSYQYDDFGRPLRITYPNNQLAVERRYNISGVHVQTINTQTQQEIWRLGNISDGRGNLTHQRYGNGVKTERVFHANSGRLSTINSGKSDIANIQTLSIATDALGRVLLRSARNNTLIEQFRYDQLNRLTQEGTSGDSASPCGQHFCYDDLGNITYKSGVGVLKYERINGAGAHAITQGGGRTYHYDAYGNVIRRGSEIVEYDVYNKPTRIGSTYFTYGADHELLNQSDNTFGLNTYYLHGAYGEEFRVVYSGVQAKYQSYVDGVMLHEANASGTAQTSYLHYDHLGSVEIITDASGNIKDRLSFDTWGERRQDNWGAGDPTMGTPFFYDTQKGYTGHEMLDHLGLIHMGGRVYDPLVSRFLSADLYIQAPFNSQSYNRYSYAFNNPLSFTDPTGYQVSGREYATDIEEILVWGCWDPRNGNAYDAQFDWMLMDQRQATEQAAGDLAAKFTESIMQHTGAPDLISAAMDAYVATQTGADLTEAAVDIGIKVVTNVAAKKIQPVKNALETGVKSARIGPTVGGGGTLDKLTNAEKKRIQNAADRSGKDIAVVGSRVNPNKQLHSKSDYDYVIDANHATRNSLSKSLPGSKDITEGIPGNQDIFKGEVETDLPHVIFHPQ